MQKIMFYVSLAAAVCMLSFVVVEAAMAAERQEEIKVYWDWDGPTPEGSGLPSADPIANDLEWHLYMRGEGEQYNYDTPVIASPYGQNLELSGDVHITGASGSTVRKYFILRAYYDGGESGDSNEVYKDFEIPRNIPFNLRFTAILSGE